MREYDIVTDSTEQVAPFCEEEPNALPKVTPILPAILDAILEWVESVALERIHFLFSSRRAGRSSYVALSKESSSEKSGRPLWPLWLLNCR